MIAIDSLRRRNAMMAVAGQPVDYELSLSLPGRSLCRLMRRHRVTVRELARRLSISMVAVRRYCRHGAAFPIRMSLEEAVIGARTPRLRACLRHWQREVLGECHG